jgi:hypothetical protein
VDGAVQQQQEQQQDGKVPPGRQMDGIHNSVYLYLVFFISMVDEMLSR